MQEPDIFKFVIAFLAVLALMFFIAWALKKAGLATVPMMQGGKRRLKIVEYATIDSRRRAVLLRRDDREHLILVGGDADCVIETNIIPPADTDGTEGKTA